MRLSYTPDELQGLRARMRANLWYARKADMRRAEETRSLLAIEPTGPRRGKPSKKRPTAM
jgi:hypothetical protein